MIISKILKTFFIVLSISIGIIGFYISTAFFLMYFPSEECYVKEEKKEKVYILYNDVHSDILFNLEELSDSWIKELPLVIGKKGYIAFGWGDKETYLDTPTWNEIKASTSLKALFINTPSLMHISYFPHIKYFTQLKTINLTKNQKNQLESVIFKSFDFKQSTYKGYGRNDVFYASPYKYNFIYTCNTWTGRRLQDANISVSYWTPFSHNIINSLP